MLLNLVQSFLRATVSHEFTTLILQAFMPVRFGFSHVRLRLYIYCTDGWLVFLNSLHLKLHCHMLIDLVQLFLRAEVSLKFAEISIRQWFLLRDSL